MNRNLFFTPELRMDFNWRDQYHLRLGSIRPQNKEQISAGLKNMGQEAIRNRFLGSKKELTDIELHYLTHLDGWNHYALGLEERGDLKRGVAVIRLVRSSHESSEAEVAITIIDEFQKMGLGTFLLNLIILAAMERDIKTLSFTYLPQNEAIEKLISRVGTPRLGESNKDYIQRFLDLKNMNQELIKSQLAKTLPLIETFHS